VLAVLTQPPVVGWQASSVHALPSLHVTAVPPQAPPEHLSLAVHELPSLQGEVLLMKLQVPCPGLQLSVVHWLPSLQTFVEPPTHVPPAHTSLSVHALPSLQVAVLLVWPQPVPTSQASFVHGFASSQVTADPPEHRPAWHASPLVHPLPSSQEVPLVAVTSAGQAAPDPVHNSATSH